MKYRDALPQLSGGTFLSDAGIETELIFHHGLDLPLFAAFDLLKDDAGRSELRRYFEPFAAMAAERGTGFILESPTWRASHGWGAQLGYSAEDVAEMNRRAIALMEEIRDSHETERSPFVISGCIGPQGDGYDPETLMSAEEAEAYHRPQVEAFAGTAADQVTAITMTYPEEAIGVVRAAADAGIPAAISFTTETDGRLPDGTSLGDAINRTKSETGGGPAYFMVNCAHPSHFDAALPADADWLEDIRGVRANASTMSHAELDEAEELDAGDPGDLARRYRELRERLPNLNILGGCCGTGLPHIRAIADAWPAR